MTDHYNGRPRPQTSFCAWIDPHLDGDALRSLMLHPETPVQIGRGTAKPRFAVARAGLLVASISGLCLVPAASLAEGTPVPAHPACVIDAATGEGTAPDGTECVLPAEEPQPTEPAAADEPAPPPPPPPPPAEAPVPPLDAAPVTDQPPAAEPAAAPASSDTASTAATAPESVSPSHPTPTAPKPAATAAPKAGARERTATKPKKRATRAKVRKTTRAKHRTRRVVSEKAAPRQQGAVSGVLQHGPGTAPFYVSDEPVIPRFLIKAYKQAGRKYHIPWTILAAINEIETDFGRNVAVSSAGATGWMQFMPATWRAYGVDADRDGVKDPDNPRDAIFAAARYLRASGAPDNMRRAIFAYNHAGWYVDSVLLRAERIALHQGGRSRTLTRLLRSGERKLVRQVLEDDRITLYDCGRQDIAAGRIDRRVLVVLRFLAWSGLHPTVSSLDCGHGTYTSAGNVSAHSYGAAVDISAINGIPILGNQGAGSVTDATIREMLTLRGTMAPAQIISLMDYEGADSTLAMGDHADHIHVGFRALADLAQ